MSVQMAVYTNQDAADDPEGEPIQYYTINPQLFMPPFVAGALDDAETPKEKPPARPSTLTPEAIDRIREATFAAVYEELAGLDRFENAIKII